MLPRLLARRTGAQETTRTGGEPRPRPSGRGRSSPGRPTSRYHISLTTAVLRVRLFFVLSDFDPSVRGMDPDPSVKKQK